MKTLKSYVLDDEIETINMKYIQEASLVNRLSNDKKTIGTSS